MTSLSVVLSIEVLMENGNAVFFLISCLSENIAFFFSSCI